MLSFGGVCILLFAVMNIVAIARRALLCCGWFVAVLWGGDGGFCGGAGWSVFLFLLGVGSLRGSLAWVLWDGVRVWRFSWGGSVAAFRGVLAQPFWVLKSAKF